MSLSKGTIVTGGSGLLGAVLNHELEDFNPVSFDINSPRHEGEFINGSVLVASELALAAQGARHMVHMAALLPARNPPERVFEVNTVGTWNALQAAEQAGCETFILISSECATGLCFQKNERPPSYLPVDERHPLSPTDAYSVSKKIGETIVEAFRQRSTMRIVILRPLFILFQEQAHSIPARQDIWHHDLWGYVDPVDVARSVKATLQTREATGTFFLSAPDTLCERATLELLEARFGKLPTSVDEKRFIDTPNAAIFSNHRAERELRVEFRSTWRSVGAKAQTHLNNDQNGRSFFAPK